MNGSRTTIVHRIALVVILAGALLVGIWALAAPQSFYDDFPGAGRMWVALDGPYNEHLVRDVGGLYLGQAFVAGFALVTGSLLVARAAGGAALVFGVPHVLYHAFNTGPFEAGDIVAMLASLTLAAVAGLVALAAPASAAADAESG